MWKVHPNFQAGQYRKVVDELLDGKSRAARTRYIASLIGALSFLGRMEEAADLFELEAKTSKLSLDRTAARFFLAIGYTRHSHYEKARLLLEENEKKAGKAPLESFFVHQGKTFFLYYTGRLNECLSEAPLARRAAIAADDLFARCLATDALGHAQVRAGEIHRGLEHLQEAEKMAHQLGNLSSAAAISISCELYRLEFGLIPGTPDYLEQLQKRFAPENNYSQANVALEMARQFTLRGRYAAAGKILESVASGIYASQNRRQEIQLNLRLAELAGRRGAFFEAKHFLWFCRRFLHQEVDASLELMALGIERKLALAEGKAEEAKTLMARWDTLSAEFPSTRDMNLRVREGRALPEKENPEDRVHLALRAARGPGALEDRLAPILERGYLAEASLTLGLPPAATGLAILPASLGLIVQSAAGIEHLEPLSSLQQKLARVLGSGREISKQEMIEKVWGYRYDSLRHDSMVYAALSSLRKALGPAGEWLSPTEAGYVFRGSIWLFEGTEPWVSENSEAPSPAAKPSTASSLPDHLISQLNHRQIEILSWLGQRQFASVKDCEKRFKVSEITALRDLRGLCDQGLVLRSGKARATRYSLANGGKF